MPLKSYDTWEEVYLNESVEGLPWFFEDLDPDFADALETFELTGGRALDLGCGPGTQSIALATRGFDVVGSDLSPSAIRAAMARAESRALSLDFVVDDILATELEGPFDLVLDRGVFHVFEPSQRSTYRENLLRLLRPGGHLLLKCFSHRQPGSEGPHRIHPDELQTTFGEAFTSLALRETEFHGNQQDENPLALVAVYRRAG